MAKKTSPTSWARDPRDTSPRPPDIAPEGVSTIEEAPAAEPAIEILGEAVVTLIAPEGVSTVGIQALDPKAPPLQLKVDRSTGQVKVPARAAARLILDHGFRAY